MWLHDIYERAQGEVLSYAELEQRVNQLGHHLMHLGVGPEVPVGVMMDRSLDLFVALLGVLKAGGAYVPMDPSYPSDRLALMMEDSEVHGWCLHKHLAFDAILKARRGLFLFLLTRTQNNSICLVCIVMQEVHVVASPAGARASESAEGICQGHGGHESAHTAGTSVPLITIC